MNIDKISKKIFYDIKFKNLLISDKQSIRSALEKINRSGLKILLLLIKITDLRV